MPEILLGLVVLLLLLWAAGAFIKADPKQVARGLRGIGGVAALLLAAFLLFRGAIGVAIPLGVFGLGLLGWVSFWPGSFGARTPPKYRVPLTVHPAQPGRINVDALGGWYAPLSALWFP